MSMQSSRYRKNVLALPFSAMQSFYLAILLFIIAVQSHATVTHSASNGFAIELSTTIKAPPIMLYRTLIRDISRWWDPEHTYSGESANLYIEDKVPGCFCEKLNERPAVQHMAVIYTAPGELLRMQGGLGPLQSMAATGTMSWSFAKKEKGSTEIRLSYHVSGYAPEGLDKLAAAVDGVLHHQLQRFKDFAEKKIRIQVKP